jgi:hypothetical protein
MGASDALSLSPLCLAFIPPSLFLSIEHKEDIDISLPVSRKKKLKPTLSVAHTAL